MPKVFLPRRLMISIILLVIIISLTLAPQAASIACEPIGGTCHCPGC